MTPQTHFRRSMIATLLVALLATLVGCGDSASDHPSPTTSTAAQPASTGQPGFLISYAAAASRLDGLDPDTTQEQIRDWATIGLANYFDLDTARLRAATFDTLPIRDPGLADLSRQQTGPGRSLYDGKGVLHLLVQKGDPHRDRTIGLLLDQYRTDAGSDPTGVQVHDYQILPDRKVVAVATGMAVPTAKVRQDNGYVSMSVDNADALKNFLDKTRNFSGLELHGSEIWANGWNWPDVPAAPMTAEDVSVLQRGYAATSGPLPGFSLDPGPKLTAADVRAIVPDLNPGLADQIASGADSPSLDQLRASVNDAVFSSAKPPAGLPQDRTRLWALDSMLTGYPPYSQARFDGPLAGTAVGMTLMYDDFEAKQWSNGVGDAVPSKAVPGFVASPDTATPWGQCSDKPISESGRLWFGQDQSGFAFSANRVDIGSRATRLFAKANGDGGEVEPSYSFGRGLTWWDENFQAVADYEPQYERLDQIMRWSGALEWLVTKAGKQLPDAGAPAGPGLKFADWYAKNNQLKERSDITFVNPPSATQEALLYNPSKAFTDCGFAAVDGGVELADGLSLQGKGNYHADLPSSVHRAGPLDPGSSYDSSTGAGHVKRELISGDNQVESYRDYALSPVSDGKASVDITAPGRNVASFGGLKENLDGHTPREAKTEISVRNGSVSEQVSLQGQVVGILATFKSFGSEVVSWSSGIGDTARQVLSQLQSKWGQPLASDTVLTHDLNGQPEYQLGGLDDPWLVVTDGQAPPSGELNFRLGAPGKPGDPAQFANGALRGPPDLGGPDQFDGVAAAVDGQPARVDPVGAPDPQARSVQFATPAGHEFKAYQSGGRWVATHSDLAHEPVVLAAFAKMPDIDNAMRDAAKAHDGHYRVVMLGSDGLALVGADRVVVVPMYDPWTAKVFKSIIPDRGPPLFDLSGEDVLTVGWGPIKIDPRAERKHTTVGDVMGQGKDAYLLDSAKTNYHLRDGVISADEIPRDTQVIVVEAPAPAGAGILDSRPDVVDYRQHQWQLVGSGGGGGGGNSPDVSRWFQVSSAPSQPTPTTGPSVTTTTSATPSNGSTVLLVCPVTNPLARECES